MFFFFLFFTVLHIFDCHLAGRRVYALECGVLYLVSFFLINSFWFCSTASRSFVFFFFVFNVRPWHCLIFLKEKEKNAKFQMKLYMFFKKLSSQIEFCFLHEIFLLNHLFNYYHAYSYWSVSKLKSLQKGYVN